MNELSRTAEEGFPSVSIVIVNLNGKQHLRECFSSIQHLKYPREKIEVVLVDNGSTDGSVEFVEKRFPWVKLLRNSRNEGFAKPSNDGARAATGEYVAFLNNDMRVQRDWLAELVNSLRRSGAQCAGSVILNWDGKLLDFAGGSLNFLGMGYQFDFHRPLREAECDLNEDRELLFACGGSMLVERKLFLDAGGFDEDFFAYFEDVDFGWRFRILGNRTVLSVKSRVFHKHHGTSGKFGQEKMDLIFNRNSLYMIYKNYSEEFLNKVFWPIVLMNYRFLFDRSRLDKDRFDLRIRTGVKPVPDKLSVPKETASKICAFEDFIENLPAMTEKRNRIQAARKVDDREIFQFIKDPFVSVGTDVDTYDDIKYEFIKLFGIDQAFGVELKRTVLLITSDTVAGRMAGPAIRYWETAKVLADTDKFNVVLACMGNPDVSYPGIRLVPYSISNPDTLLDAARHSDIVMLHGFLLDDIPKLRKIVAPKYVIVDLYDPFMIENMEIFREYDRGEQVKRHREASEATEFQLQFGDFFVCANEKQRDYWIGMLSAYSRVNPRFYASDRTGESLIGLMPFGISDKPPAHTAQVLKGKWPGIGPDDKVILWGGGVWNWFDPLTLIRAVKRISETRQDVKLFFMGVTHPNPAIPKMKMLTAAVELAKELGVYDRYVFFNFGWVEYEQRQNYLLEADLGVSCHFKTLETRFSFRTRILDYLWADLPIVCTKGDYFGDLVESARLGKTVDFENDGELAETICSLLDDPAAYVSCKDNIRKVAEGYKWSRVSRSVLDFCMNPRHLGPQRLQKDHKQYTIPEDFYEDRSAKPEMHAEGARDSSFAPRRAMRGGSLAARIGEIENRQKSIESSVAHMEKTSRKTYKVVREIEEWSYMMNTRFNKVKKLANPLYSIKALFRKIFRR